MIDTLNNNNKFTSTGSPIFHENGEITVSKDIKSKEATIKDLAYVLRPVIKAFLIDAGKPVYGQIIYDKCGLTRSTGYKLLRILTDDKQVIKQLYKHKAYYSVKSTYQDLYVANASNNDIKGRIPVKNGSSVEREAFKLLNKIKIRCNSSHLEKMDVNQIMKLDKKKGRKRGTYLNYLRYLVNKGFLSVKKIGKSNYYFLTGV